MIAPKTLLACVLAVALAAFPAAAQADFGFVPESFAVSAENSDTTPDAQAGSHPYAFTVHCDLKTEGSGKTEGHPGGIGGDVQGHAHKGHDERAVVWHQGRQADA